MRPTGDEGSGSMFDALLEDEMALFDEMARALSSAAEAARRIEDPAALAALQEKNLAAFEAMTAAAGRQAAALLRQGVDEALARLDAADAEPHASDGDGEAASNGDPSPGGAAEHDVGDMVATLRAHRRRTLLDSINRVSASFDDAETSNDPTAE